MLISHGSRLMTVIGILIPLAGVGSAVALEIESAAIARAAAEGSTAGRVGERRGSTTGEGTGSGTAGNDPDAIGPDRPVVPPASPPNSPGGTTSAIAKPADPDPKVNDPAFIGNALWVAPGVMTSMSNTIWQETQTTSDPDMKRVLNAEAVSNYYDNQANVLKRYNDALLTTTDNASIYTLLSVLAGGGFMEPQWSQDIFKSTSNADIISRQINTGWGDKTGRCIHVHSFIFRTSLETKDAG